MSPSFPRFCARHGPAPQTLRYRAIERDTFFFGVGISREDVEDLWITRNLEYPRSKSQTGQPGASSSKLEMHCYGPCCWAHRRPKAPPAARSHLDLRSTNPSV